MFALKFNYLSMCPMIRPRVVWRLIWVYTIYFVQACLSRYRVIWLLWKKKMFWHMRPPLTQITAHSHRLIWWSGSTQFTYGTGKQLWNLKALMELESSTHWQIRMRRLVEYNRNTSFWTVVTKPRTTGKLTYTVERTFFAFIPITISSDQSF